MAAVRHIGFFKIDFLNISMQNFIEIGQTVAEIAIYPFFQDGGHLPFWICVANFWMT